MIKNTCQRESKYRRQNVHVNVGRVNGILDFSGKVKASFGPSFPL